MRLLIVTCALISTALCSSNVAQQFLGGGDAKKVPGDMSWEYVGDSSNDILAIESLKTDWVDDGSQYGEDFFAWHIELQGELLADLGPDPSIEVTVYRDGVKGPSAKTKLCGEQDMAHMFVIRQNGMDVCPLHKKGRVEIHDGMMGQYGMIVPGQYTMRWQVRDTDGQRVTDIQSTKWIEGTATEDYFEMLKAMSEV